MSPPKLQLTIHVKYSFDEIMGLLMDQFDHEGLYDLITHIDAEICDPEFTKKVRDYFTQKYAIRRNNSWTIK